MKRTSKRPLKILKPADTPKHVGNMQEDFPEFTPQNWDPRIGKRHKQAGSIEKYRAMLQKVKRG